MQLIFSFVLCVICYSSIVWAVLRQISRTNSNRRTIEAATDSAFLSFGDGSDVLTALERQSRSNDLSQYRHQGRREVRGKIIEFI